MTLDSDTRLLVERAMRERDVTFKEALNDAIRVGLSAAVDGDGASEPITVPHALHARVDLTKALALADELEDDEILRQLHAGR